MATTQEQIVSILDQPSENALEAELTELRLESCKRAYMYAGKHQHARRA